ncbi:hypothetical protein AVEN_49497-1 [Araneus ventricosus]|uniref:Uncharacterized protein n=1 Tax=Araneus ventricosus TaxID=182803 RepID=A0A4Y2U5H2_ARAVE|nr:hypothetical protein AVEN_49497-1 [Araneus ventricosus]
MLKSYEPSSLIPKKEYDTEEAIHRYLYNDSYNNEDLFWIYGYASKARTFMIGYKDSIFFLKCYSDNLHLYQSRSKPETLKIDLSTKTGDLFSAIALDQKEIEPFYPIDGPQVFFGIHSPYVPIDFADLHAIRPGKRYDFYVQMASIHLFIFCYKE